MRMKLAFILEPPRLGVDFCVRLAPEKNISEVKLGCVVSHYAAHL
jgi:hypothetical protein